MPQPRWLNSGALESDGLGSNSGLLLSSIPPLKKRKSIRLICCFIKCEERKRKDGYQEKMLWKAASQVSPQKASVWAWRGAGDGQGGGSVGSSELLYEEERKEKRVFIAAA